MIRGGLKIDRNLINFKTFIIDGMTLKAQSRRVKFFRKAEVRKNSLICNGSIQDDN